MFALRSLVTEGRSAPLYSDLNVAVPADIPIFDDCETKRRISKRGTVIAAAVALVASLIYLAWMAFNIGGDRLATAVSETGLAAAAFAGAAGCWYSATHNRRHDRRAWSLLGAACFSWGLGEIAWSVYVAMGTKTPFPSLADIGYVGETFLALLAMLSFGTVRLAGSSRTKMLLDAAVVAGSLLFLGWITLLGAVYLAGAGGLFAQVLGLAYPVGDVLIITLAGALMVQAPSGAKLVYGLIGCGVFATAISDSVFAYATTASTSGNFDDMVLTGWVVGFLLIGLAGLQPERRHRSGLAKLPGYSEILLPYGAILLVVGGYLVAIGIHINNVALLLGGATISVALMRLLLTSMQNLRQIRVLHTQAAILETHFATHPDPTKIEHQRSSLGGSDGTEYSYAAGA